MGFGWNNSAHLVVSLLFVHDLNNIILKHLSLSSVHSQGALFPILLSAICGSHTNWCVLAPFFVDPIRSVCAPVYFARMKQIPSCTSIESVHVVHVVTYSLTFATATLHYHCQKNEKIVCRAIVEKEVNPLHLMQYYISRTTRCFVAWSLSGVPPPLANFKCAHVSHAATDTPDTMLQPLVVKVCSISIFISFVIFCVYVFMSSSCDMSYTPSL